MRYLKSFEEHGVRGAIVNPAGESITDIERYAKRGHRVVLIDMLSASALISSVSVDGEAGAYLAATHLLELGHRRIGFINGPATFRQGRERRRGLLRALADAHLDERDALLEVTVDPVNSEQGETAVAGLIRAGTLPSGLFCVNDFTAFGALRSITDAGLSVPDDVAVVGFDDIPFSSMLVTPLSSIRQPARRMGETAATLMMRTPGDAAESAQHVRFTPELVVRRSTVGVTPSA